MSQKTDKMLKLALVFFISLLSFSIGTFVGKKYSDNQHKLAQLEPQKKEVATHDFAASSADSKSAEPKDSSDPLLTDSEVAKIAEEFATDSETEVESKMEKTVGSVETNEKDIKEIPRGTKAVTSSPSKTVAATQAKQIQNAIEKIKTMDAARDVASIPPGVSQYTVQVGSFPTQAEAQKLSQDLVNKGFKSSSVAAQVNGQTWHRVHVGLFGSVKEAQDYKKDFLDKTKLTAAIVQRVK